MSTTPDPEVPPRWMAPHHPGWLPPGIPGHDAPVAWSIEWPEAWGDPPLADVEPEPEAGAS